MDGANVIARTERLALRSGVPDDAEALRAAIGDWPMVRMLERVPWPYTVNDAAAWFVDATPGAEPEPLIVHASSGRIVGGVALVGKEAVDLGYRITPSA